jgi:hypothetical protein
MLLWIGEGLGCLESLVVGRLQVAAGCRWPRWASRVSVATIIVVVIAAVPVVRQMRAAMAPPVNAMDKPNAGALYHKEIGYILKGNLPPGKIMTRWARIAFYAERDWLGIPKAELAEIIEAARAGGARFLVVDESIADIRPGLIPLIEPLAIEVEQETLEVTPDYPVIKELGIRPYMRYFHPERYGVAVFEIVK